MEDYRDKQDPRVFDKINRPAHYCSTSIEPIDVIEAWKLPFHLGNVLKYLARFDKKDGLDDLRKASWYLDRWISQQEKS